MSQARVKAVVSLPLETFAPFGTQTKTSVLFLEKPLKDEKIDFSYDVFMGNIDDIGYDATGRSTGSKDVEELLKAWREFNSNSQTLSVERSRAYITQGDNIQFRWDFKAGSIDIGDDFVAIGEYLDVVKESKNLQKMETDIFPYLSIPELPNNPFYIKEKEIQHVPGGKLIGSKKIAKGGDILFVRLGPSMGNRKSLMLDENIEKVYCSGEFHVLRPKEGIPSEYILFLVKSNIFIAQAKSKARGATPSRLRLHETDLPLLKVPKHSKEEIEKFGEIYLNGRLKADELIMQANNIMLDVSPDF